MNKFMNSAAASAVVAILALAGAAQANTLHFQINPNFDTGGTRQVFIFGAPNTTGSVIGANGFLQEFDLGPEGFITITIPTDAELGSDVIENKGFRIESDGAVSGYLLNRRTASTDMTYLIDSTSLGTDHFIAGYQNILQDQMSVQATQDNTVITFSPRGGAPVQITLNAGQTYMFDSSTELTGSRITSDKPIAVFSGNQCTNVPTGNTACDHLVEQIPAVNVLSTTYLLAKTPRTGTQGNVVRVVATADNTEVRFNGDLVATLNAGEFFEGRTPDGVEIVATHKVLVAQYLIGSTQAGAVTDPAMVIIPGQDQWLDSYVFAAPSGEADFPTDFVSIIMATADIGSLIINGLAADASAFAQLGSTLFSFADFDVSGISGPFAITADSPFLLLLSGFDDFDSYFTYGGARFSPGASPPPPPPPPSGTDVFWDGDGNPNDGVVNGGDGTLTANSVNLTVENGATNNTLPVQPANIIFTGLPGIVTVDDSAGQILIDGLEFRVSGYSIVGDPLTLGAASTFLVSGDADSVATIDSIIQGNFGFSKTGAGRLVLNGINTYTGNTVINAGTLQGSATSFSTGEISIGGTLIVAQPTDAIMANVLSGNGFFSKQGAGRLTLTGESSFGGFTNVDAGRLHVDGLLASSLVTVNTGATLGGNGTVGGVNALPGSTVAPGASIGTLTVDGDYVQATGSVYQTETTSAGATDLIDVTGTANLAPGAILNLIKLDTPRFVLGTRYTVLSADDGLTGTFQLAGQTRVSAFINVVASYDASNAYLDVRQTRALNAAGITPNQVAAASGADAAGNGALYQALVYLQTDAEAQYAFDQISGEIHASARGAMLQDTRFIREAVGSRLAAGHDASTFWLNGYGAFGRFDADGNAAEVKRDISGVFFGADVPFGDGLVGGLVAGFGDANIKVDDRSAKADASDMHLGAYIGYDDGALSAHVGVANMWREVTTSRAVVFPGFASRVRAEYDVSVFQVFGDVGYAIDLGGFELEPFAAVAYVDVGDSDFSEEGGVAALSSRGDNTDDFLVTQLGARLNVELGAEPGELGLTASMGWKHYSSGELTSPISLGFQSGPAFSIAGAPISENVAAVGVALVGRVDDDIEVDVGYSGQFGDGLADHGARASLIFRF
jgi:outer membrane autotransporter protein